MTVNEYRNETTAKLVKLDERQITIVMRLLSLKLGAQLLFLLFLCS